MQKPKQCPKCKSVKIQYITYGMPPEPAPKGVFYAGCIISDHDPEWHCDACNWQWGPGVEGSYYQEED